MAQTNSNSLHKYSQLAADHFRLIELKKLTPVLDIRLDDYSDHSSTTYHAVSYAWGLEPSTEGIICNGRQFKITPHLLAGLQAIFEHHRDTRLWVDSICIDQGSDQEKSEQVAKMHHIYRKAEGVYVWLGKEEDGSDEIMNSIKNVRVPDQPPRGDDDETLIRILNIKFESPKLFEASEFKAIAALGRRSWFKRLWVFQECYFARSLTFFCGVTQVEGDQFLKVLNNLTINSFGPVEPPGINEEDDLFGGFTALKEVMKIKADQTPYRKARTFFDYVVLGRNRLAKEPVDHIYAVFGITEEWENVYQRNLKVDYSQGAREKYWQLYTAFGKVAMVEESNLRLLSIVDSIQRPNELPSWCPNLHSRMSLTSLGENCSYAAGWPWAGHGKTSSPDSCRRHLDFLGQGHNHASVSLSSNTISVWGASIGQISEVGMPRNWDLEMYSDDLAKVKPLAEALLVWFSASEEFCKSHYHGPSNPLGVWHRVLVGGGNRSRRPPRTDLKTKSEAYQSTETEHSGVGDDMVAGDQETESDDDTDDTAYSLLQSVLNQIVHPEAEWTVWRHDVLKTLQMCYVWLMTIEETWTNRVLFSISNGSIGFSANGIQNNDEVVSLYGGPTLYVLRKVGSNYRYIGEAYVYGCVDGELFEMLDEGVVVEGVFSIS